jgi:hypothetical protein
MGIATILSLLSMGGCTRPQDEVSHISISIPQGVFNQSVGSLAAGDVPAHVVINVTSDGKLLIPPVAFDAHDGNTPIPSEIPLDIPTGSNRLIQVVAVYKNTTTNLMSFYYGDVAKSLSSGTESVNINLNSFSSGAVEGHVFGRYLDTAASGPTGVVLLKYDPGNSKPMMIVDRSLMLNGWFEVFMLTGTPFVYTLDSGRVLFDGPISLDSGIFTPSAGATNVMRVSLPAHQRLSSAWKPEGAGVKVYGWFADSAQASLVSGQVVCRPASLDQLSKMSKYSSTASPLTGLLNNTLPTVAQLNLTDGTSLSNYFVNGGLSDVSSQCTNTANIFMSTLMFNSTMIDGQGNDGAAPFNVPFQKLGAGSPFAISGAANRIIDAQLLPGLVGQIDSVQVFKKITTVDEQNDSVSCPEGVSAANGYVEAGSATPGGDGHVTIQTNITLAEAASGVTAVICSSKAGTMIPLGIAIRKDNFGGGGGIATPADGYNLKMAWDHLALNQCHFGAIELTSTQSFNVLNSANLSFNLAVTGLAGGALSIYNATDMSCSLPIAGAALTLNSPDTRKLFRFKLTSGSTPTTPNIQVTTSAFSGLTVNTPFTFGSASTATQFNSKMNQMSLGNNACIPLDIYRLDAAGFPVPTSGTDTVTVTSTPTGAIDIFSDPQCSTNLNLTFSYITTEFAKRIYIKRVNGSGEVSVTFHDGSLSDFIFIGDPTPWADHLKVKIGEKLAPSLFAGTGDCVPLQVNAYDASDTLITTTLGGTINSNVMVDTGQLFSSMSACSGHSGGSSSFPATTGPSNGSGLTFWYRGNTSGPVTISTSGSPRIAKNVANSSLSLNISTLNPGSTPFSAPLGWFDASPYGAQVNGTTIGSWSPHFGGSLSLSDMGFGSMATLVATSPWRSFEFSGSGGTGTALSGSTSVPGSFTVAARVRLTTLGVDQGLLQFLGSGCLGSTVGTTCALSIGSDNSIQMFGYSSAPSVLNDLNWHTIVAVRTGTTNVSVYLDDVLILSNAVTGSQSSAYTSLQVGYLSSDSNATKKWFKGDIGDLIIYNADETANRTPLHAYLSQKHP